MVCFLSARVCASRESSKSMLVNFPSMPVGSLEAACWKISSRTFNQTVRPEGFVLNLLGVSGEQGDTLYREYVC